MADNRNEMIAAMESVLARIGAHFGVDPGNVDGLFAAIEAQSTEGAIMREALRKIAEEHDADGSMRFEAQAALDSVSGRQNDG